jgi:hypothetical protein
MAAVEIAPDKALAVVRDMVKASHGVLVRKHDVPGMEFVRAWVDVLHKAGVKIPSGQEFDLYSHTIGPFVLLADMQPATDLVFVAAHECEHVAQFWGGEFRDGSTVGKTLEGGLAFAWLYLVEPEARVRFEARAYRATMEAMHMLGHELPDVEVFVDALARGYALGEEHVKFGQQLLESAIASVSDGVYTTRGGAVALNALKQHGVIR